MKEKHHGTDWARKRAQNAVYQRHSTPLSPLDRKAIQMVIDSERRAWGKYHQAMRYAYDQLIQRHRDEQITPDKIWKQIRKDLDRASQV